MPALAYRVPLCELMVEGLGLMIVWAGLLRPCRCRWVPLLLGAGALAAPVPGPLVALGSKQEATVSGSRALERCNTALRV